MAGKKRAGINIRALLRGISTHVPGLSNLFSRDTGGTSSARYCYAVWLRHLVMAHKNGLLAEPNTIAELGPGDSLGIGLAALLSGMDRYFAFDIVKYANNERNVEVFEDLLNLFKRQERIPDENEFPEIKPYLETYEFPNYILTDKRLNISLAQKRVEAIRETLLNLNNHAKNSIQISYFVPWYDKKVMLEESVDMIYSQAVLEHVNDLARVYEIMHSWLKPGGFISHEIDFRSHGMTREWNGHWACSNFLWKLIKGKRLYLLNREPHSTHIQLMQKAGFEIVCDLKTKGAAGISRKRLAPQFKSISDEDLITEGSFIQAVKRK